MSAAELAQFRLQQIRSLEYQHVLEKENVELKQVIESLRNIPKVDDSEPKLIKLAFEVKSWLSKMKMELEQTKGFCVLQNSQINFLNQTIKENITIMSESSQRKLADYERLQIESDEYKKKCEELDLKLIDLIKLNQTNHMKMKTLSIELEECKQTNSILIQNGELLNEKVTLLTESLEDVESKYESSAMEVITLKKKIMKLESVNGEELQAAIQGYQAQIMEYERVCVCVYVCGCC